MTDTSKLIVLKNLSQQFFYNDFHIILKPFWTHIIILDTYLVCVLWSYFSNFHFILFFNNHE